ncbi:hypothetical protein IWX80_002426 [Flavobacterium sp. CAN_S2]
MHNKYKYLFFSILQFLISFSSKLLLTGKKLNCIVVASEVYLGLLLYFNIKFNIFIIIKVH